MLKDVNLQIVWALQEGKEQIRETLWIQSLNLLLSGVTTTHEPSTFIDTAKSDEAKISWIALLICIQDIGHPRLECFSTQQEIYCSRISSYMAIKSKKTSTRFHIPYSRYHVEIMCGCSAVGTRIPSYFLYIFDLFWSLEDIAWSKLFIQIRCVWSMIQTVEINAECVHIGAHMDTRFMLRRADMSWICFGMIWRHPFLTQFMSHLRTVLYTWNKFKTFLGTIKRARNGCTQLFGKRFMTYLSCWTQALLTDCSCPIYCSYHSVQCTLTNCEFLK